MIGPLTIKKTVKLIISDFRKLTKTRAWLSEIFLKGLSSKSAKISIRIMRPRCSKPRNISTKCRNLLKVSSNSKTMPYFTGIRFNPKHGSLRSCKLELCSIKIRILLRFCVSIRMRTWWSDLSSSSASSIRRMLTWSGDYPGSLQKCILSNLFWSMRRKITRKLCRK